MPPPPHRDNGIDIDTLRWGGMLAGGGLLALLCWVSPSRLVEAIFLGLTTVAVIGGVASGVQRHQPTVRWPWMLSGASMGCFGIGAVLTRLLDDRSATSPSPVAMVAFIAGALLFAVSGYHLIRARHGNRPLSDLIDATVIASASSIVVWRILVAPHALQWTGRYFIAATTGGVLWIGARLLGGAGFGPFGHGGERRDESTALAVAGYVIVGIAGGAAVLGPIDSAVGTIDWLISFWPLAAVCIATAALYPSMTLQAQPGSATADTSIAHWRLYCLGASLVVPLVVGSVTDLTDRAGPVIFGLGAMMVVLVTMRAAMVFQQTEYELHGRMAAERELQQQARFDTLSGLPNRALFTNRLEHALHKAKRHDLRLAVLYLDLDRFKVINDSFGQNAGDEALITVAARLRQAIRGQDTPARLSGDEFAVILEEIEGVEDARIVAERIRASMREPIPVAGTSVVIGTSIGVSVYDQHGTANELLREADAALSDAKKKGRNAVVVFDAAMRQHIAQSLAFEHDLVNAVERGELRLFYQPQIDMATGAVSGMEALIRWQHPVQGLLSPAAFMGIAEDTGLIVPIGAWVIDEACRQHRRWQAVLGPEMVPHIAVNVSPSQLSRDDVAARIRRTLAATRLQAKQLHIEITEVALMNDPERAIAALEAIEALGVPIAVDDFGTGYFSLSHLRRFPVHKIKIDQSFVRGIGSSTEDEAIINATIDLAHALGLSVVAEGIETEDQIDYLRRRDCDVGQGYYFAKPMAPDHLAEFLRRWGGRHGVLHEASDGHRLMAPITGPGARAVATEAARRMPPPPPMAPPAPPVAPASRPA